MRDPFLSFMGALQRHFELVDRRAPLALLRGHGAYVIAKFDAFGWSLEDLWRDKSSCGDKKTKENPVKTKEEIAYEEAVEKLEIKKNWLLKRTGKSWEELSRDIDELAQDIDAWSKEEEALIPENERRILLGVHMHGLTNPLEYALGTHEHVKMRAQAMAARYNKNRREEGSDLDLFSISDDGEIKINLEALAIVNADERTDIGNLISDLDQ